MGREDNLVKGDEAHKLTAEEASMGGKASVEARRKKRDLRRAIESLLEKEFVDTENGTVYSGAEVLAINLFKKAKKGDTKAFELIRDTVGQKPVEKIMIAEVEQDVIDEVEKAILNDK